VRHGRGDRCRRLARAPGARARAGGRRDVRGIGSPGFASQNVDDQCVKNRRLTRALTSGCDQVGAPASHLGGRDDEEGEEERQSPRRPEYQLPEWRESDYSRDYLSSV
jgi:hypothetical protein